MSAPAGPVHRLTFPLGDELHEDVTRLLLQSDQFIAMPQKKHRVHEVDDDVLQGVWLRKNTYRGVKVTHKGVPGVQGPPSPSKRPSSPVKPTSEETTAPPHDSFDHDDLFTARDSAFTWGKVC